MAILNLSGKDIVIKSLPVPEFSSYLQKKIQESEVLYPDLPGRFSALPDHSVSSLLALPLSETPLDKDFHLYVRMRTLLKGIQGNSQVLLLGKDAVHYDSMSEYLLEADLSEGISLL